MTDVEIIERLRTAGRTMRASEVGRLLGELAPSGLSASVMIVYFQRSFPGIPLRTLLNAGAWCRVSGGGLDDDGFDALLAPWLPTSPGR